MELRTSRNNIIRLKEKLLGNYQIGCGENTTAKKLSKVFIKGDIESQRKRHSGKVANGYYEKTLEQDLGIDRSLSFSCKKDHSVQSECDNCLSAIQDQELPIKYLRSKRVLGKGNIPNQNNQ